MKPSFKNRVANLLAKVNFYTLKMLGENLPTHIAKDFLKKDDSFFLHDKSIIHNTPMMVDCYEIYESAMQKTGMIYADNFSKRIRHFMLFQLAMNAIKRDKGKSQIAECGCWRGQSAYIIAKAIELNNMNNNLFIFDSFEGLSDFAPNDLLENSLEEAQKQKLTFSADENLVKNNLQEFDFIKYFKGWIPARFKEVESQTFCFVNIDVDLYDPIRDSLEFFYPRLTTGGIIFLDDYGFTQFPGAGKAIDEFIARTPSCQFVCLPTGGAYLMKH